MQLLAVINKATALFLYYVEKKKIPSTILKIGILGSDENYCIKQYTEEDLVDENAEILFVLDERVLEILEKSDLSTHFVEAMPKKKYRDFIAFYIQGDYSLTYDLDTAVHSLNALKELYICKYVPFNKNAISRRDALDKFIEILNLYNIPYFLDTSEPCVLFISSAVKLDCIKVDMARPQELSVKETASWDMESLILLSDAAIQKEMPMLEEITTSVNQLTGYQILTYKIPLSKNSKVLEFEEIEEELGKVEDAVKQAGMVCKVTGNLGELKIIGQPHQINKFDASKADYTSIETIQKFSENDILRMLLEEI